MTTPSSASIPSSGSPMSAPDQLLADFTLLLNDARNAYLSVLSSMTALWQQADTLALQRLDVLLSLEARAMGLADDTLTRDLLFASALSSNGV